VAIAMKEYYGEDYDIAVNQVVKNNDNVLDGLMIRSDEQRIAPTIYLNRFYDEYQDGRTIESIVREVHAIYEDIMSHANSGTEGTINDFCYVANGNNGYYTHDFYLKSYGSYAQGIDSVYYNANSSVFNAITIN
jgi:hypothetical protein